MSNSFQLQKHCLNSGWLLGDYLYNIKRLEQSGMITYEEFEKVDLRSGIIVNAETFPKARKPAYKVCVDFGDDIGVKQTSAQITHHYTPESLIGKQVVGCINLGDRNIAGFISQFLLVGFADSNGSICLVTVDPTVPKGQKLF